MGLFLMKGTKMKIEKILNNNVVVSVNDLKQEVILMGKGLGFGKRVGDVVEENFIEKSFTIDKDSDVVPYLHLFQELDLEYFSFTECLINMAKVKLGKKLNNSIYITLTDHIATLEERAKVNAYIKNTMLWDIQRLYKDEFIVARRMVELINEHFSSSFDDHEAANITMHLVNAQMNTDFSKTMDITKFMTDLLNIIKYHFKIEYEEDSLTYYRFITHLRFFAQRVHSGSTFNSQDDIGLLDVVKVKYAKYYEGTLVIQKFIERNYNYVLEDEEMLYLTIHIAKVVRESAKTL